MEKQDSFFGCWKKNKNQPRLFMFCTEFILSISSKFTTIPFPVHNYRRFYNQRKWVYFLLVARLTDIYWHWDVAYAAVWCSMLSLVVSVSESVQRWRVAPRTFLRRKSVVGDLLGEFGFLMRGRRRAGLVSGRNQVSKWLDYFTLGVIQCVQNWVTKTLQCWFFARKINIDKKK